MVESEKLGTTCILTDSSQALFQDEKGEILTVKCERQQWAFGISKACFFTPLRIIKKRRYTIHAEAFSPSIYLQETALLFAK